MYKGERETKNKKSTQREQREHLSSIVNVRGYTTRYVSLSTGSLLFYLSFFFVYILVTGGMRREHDYERNSGSRKRMKRPAWDLPHLIARTKTETVMNNRDLYHHPDQINPDYIFSVFLFFFFRSVVYLNTMYYNFHRMIYWKNMVCTKFLFIKIS